MDSELDEMDQLSVEYLAAGMTDAAAALEVGCSSKTVQRRRKDPGFSAAVAARETERVGQVAAMLGEAAVDAVATMRDGLVPALDTAEVCCVVWEECLESALAANEKHGT